MPRCGTSRRPASGPPHSSWDGSRWAGRGVGLWPDHPVIEAHLVLAGFSGLQVRGVDESVVVVPDAESWRGATKHLHLAGSVSLDPYGRIRRTDVSQERADDEVRHGIPDQGAGWRVCMTRRRHRTRHPKDARRCSVPVLLDLVPKEGGHDRTTTSATLNCSTAFNAGFVTSPLFAKPVPILPSRTGSCVPGLLSSTARSGSTR